MTAEDLMRVRMLIAQGRAESLSRQNAELDKFFEVVCEVATFWREQAPEGIEYPAELKRKIEALEPGR